MTDGDKITEVRFDFGKLRQLGEKGWLRAAAFVAISESASAEGKLESLNIEAEFSYQFFPEPLPIALADEVRAEFRRWVVLGGLLEIEQGLALFLDEAFTCALLASLHGKKVPEGTNERIQNFSSDTNIASKANKLAAEFGLNLNQLLEHAHGWSQARNCLRHARGIVRARDYNLDHTLVVSWNEPTLQAEDGSVLKIGSRVEKDTKILFSFPIRQKPFRLGELIELSVKEMLHICFAAHLGMQQCLKSLEEFVVARGVPMERLGTES